MSDADKKKPPHPFDPDADAKFDASEAVMVAAVFGMGTTLLSLFKVWFFKHLAEAFKLKWPDVFGAFKIAGERAMDSASAFGIQNIFLAGSFCWIVRGVLFLAPVFLRAEKHPSWWGWPVSACCGLCGVLACEGVLSGVFHGDAKQTQDILMLAVPFGAIAGTSAGWMAIWYYRKCHRKERISDR